MRTLLSVVLLLCAMSAHAQGKFEVTPTFGYRWGGDLETDTGQNLTLQGGTAYGLCLDYSPNSDDPIKLELLWSRQESGIDFNSFGGLKDVDVTVDQFMIGGLLQGTYGKLYGHLTGLMGATLFNPEDMSSEVRFGLSIGGGLKYYLFRNVALRADVRGYCDILEGDTDFIYVGGITVAHFTGNTLWQGEITAGITIAF